VNEPGGVRSAMNIWVDADACPRLIRDVIFNASRRLQVPVRLVANSGLAVPRSPLISQVQVGGAIDAADRHIVEQCAVGDLVVTADLPLAAAAVDKGAVVITPSGTVYTAGNVQEALASRNLLAELRESGIMEGGAAPFGTRERTRFANALDRELTRLRR